MAELESAPKRVLVVYGNQPLFGIPLQKGGEEVVQYFADENGPAEASTSASIQRPPILAGAWKDLGDWNDVLDELDRIRHESKPTLSVDL